MAGIDWHSAVLVDDTIIDASYRHTQNVRRYFKARLGQDFTMSRDFMAWMKANRGANLGAACEMWRKMNAKGSK